MTALIAHIRRLIRLDGFLPTRERWEETVVEVNHLIERIEIIQQVLEGTGHSIEKDESGRYYLKGPNAEHYPLRSK